jgi:imidazole glycerol phosphate synthase glutamine amidotransferase subunit
MSLRVGIVDYRMGNLHSIASAVTAVGGDVVWCTDAASVRACDRIVFPGVGSFGACMRNLHEAGLDEAMVAHVRAGRPLLGICLGFQALFEKGTEGGDYAGLGLVSGRVRRFDIDLHVPHVGWNELHFRSQHPVFAGIAEGSHMYFVHSYYPDDVDPSAVVATSDYGVQFVCAVGNGSVVGTQFHPEKSSDDGLRLLSNFVRWSP